MTNFDSGESIVVIGGANMDIEGVPDGELIMTDSNPGSINTNLGGVGRNIADILSHLRDGIRFVSVVGDDNAGNVILKQAKSQGIDISNVAVLPGERTSSYLYVRKAAGEMVVAIADMAIVTKLDKHYLKACLKRMDSASYIIIDANLSKESIEYLAENLSHAKLIYEGVSTAKALRIKDCIQYFEMIKLNRLEAEILLGITIRTDDDLKDAAERLIDLGVKRVLITSGKDGAYYQDAQTFCARRAYSIEAVNVNGAGDALLAGFVYKLSCNAQPSECLEFALGLAALCVGSPKVAPDNLSVTMIERFIKENN